jgi:F0F1-type ATP synthase membrane subunit c/vacuolar-type H+-ATPase subunit K
MEEQVQLISPQEAEAKVAARYRVFLVLWMAILTSVVLFLALALAVAGTGVANPMLSYSLLGIGLIVVIVSVLLKQRLVKQAIEKREIQSLQSAYIIGMALCESAALFGLLDHFVTGSNICWFTFLFAATGMLLHFPKKDHLRAVAS